MVDQQAGGTLLAACRHDPPADRLRARHGHPARSHPRRRRDSTHTNTSCACAAPRSRAGVSWPAITSHMDPGDPHGPASRHSHHRACVRPARGLDPRGRRAEAEALGWTVVDPESVVVTHLTETIRVPASELLTRQETRQLLDQLKEVNAAVVDEVVPDVLSVGEICGWTTTGSPGSNGFPATSATSTCGYRRRQRRWPGHRRRDGTRRAHPRARHRPATNRGGVPNGVIFWTSYLFPDDQTHLNSIYDRTSGTTRQYWSLAYLPGERYLDRPGLRTDQPRDVLRRRGVLLQPQVPGPGHADRRDDPGRGAPDPDLPDHPHP